MQDLNIALIQADVVWEDQAANTTRFDAHLANVPADTHLIVLPEMFATGFSMRPDRLAQSMDGPTVAWMRSRSRKTGADITGSVIIAGGGGYFNRLIWAKPAGALMTYDKKHLFRYAGEEKIYTAGRRRLVVDCRGWKICPFVCYDLRFPIWTRNLHNIYDAAIFVASWPEQRAPHWNALLRARAIENQCYVVGVNRVGTDGNGYRYRGDSSIFDPMGRLVAAKRRKEAVISAVMSAHMVADYRRRFPAWMDADDDLLVDKSMEAD